MNLKLRKTSAAYVLKRMKQKALESKMKIPQFIEFRTMREIDFCDKSWEKPLFVLRQIAGVTQLQDWTKIENLIGFAPLDCFCMRSAAYDAMNWWCSSSFLVSFVDILCLPSRSMLMDSWQPHTTIFRLTSMRRESTFQTSLMGKVKQA